MRTHPSRTTARRLAGTLLLALAPLALMGGPEAHLGHGAAEAQTLIFAEASHAGQATHWDAADSARNRRCPDCLTPPQPLEPVPMAASRFARTGDGGAVPIEASGPIDSRLDRARHSRAPPQS